MTGDLAKQEVQPFSKETQLARQTKRYHRKVASPKRWEGIAAAKQGPCRVCGKAAPNELHHLIPRSQGGSDTESNMVPMCKPGPGTKLAKSLEDFFERRLGVRYERA